MRKVHAVTLSLLLTGWVASSLYFFSLGKSSTLDSIVVQRVIDGDTLETKDGKVLRLANINTPERGTYGYQEAKEYLSQYQNKTLKAHLLGSDKRGERSVAQLYTQKGQYLNLNMVQQGLASKAWTESDEQKEFARAEQEAIAAGRGLWKPSPYQECVKLTVNARDEVVTIKNTCNNVSFNGWWIKDESREVYHFTNSFVSTLSLYTKKGTNTNSRVYWGKANGTTIWNNDADTAYLFDNQNRLVSAVMYGYPR